MNVSLFRWVDRHIGIPLCFLCTLARRAADRIAPPDMRAPTRRLLFLKPSEQGAMVVAVPAFEKAVKRLGRENVFICVFGQNREILDILGVIPRENILTIRDDGLLRFLAGILKFLCTARRAGIDTIVDFEFLVRFTALLSFLAGARRRVGWHRFASEGMYRGDLLTHRVQYNPYLSMAQSFLLLTETSWMDPAAVPMTKTPVPAIAPGYPLPAYHPAPEELSHVRAVLEEGGISGDGGHPRLVLNPKFLDELPVRQWSAANFAAVARRFLEAFPEGSVIVVGLPNEAQAAKTFCDEVGGKRVLNLAGKINLRELITLLGLCDALLTTDSGPGHFAALTNIRIFALFGPETPVLFAPLSARAHIISANYACSPCFNTSNYRVSTCLDNQCLKAITPDSVFEVIRGELG